MLALISRVLSIVLALAIIFHVRQDGQLIIGAAISMAFACVLIWFPEEIDEFTFGTTRFGYQIDSHTPAILIAAVGWLILGVFGISIFWPGWIGKFFGM